MSIHAGVYSKKTGKKVDVGQTDYCPAYVCKSGEVEICDDINGCVKVNSRTYTDEKHIIIMKALSFEGGKVIFPVLYDSRWKDTAGV